MIDAGTVEAALDDLRPGLDADGFHLRVGVISPAEIEIVLAATPLACLDCLVPDDLIVGMIADALGDRALPGAGVPNVVLRKEGC
jgi:hypothetical protein